MSSDKKFGAQFRELLQLEQDGRERYGYYIEKIEDPFLLKRFKEIYTDESKHVEIVQGFINTLSRKV
jgi:rubrerythrin